ncbi:hypothetical protein Tco_0589119 [Tanacetum coccineum]
MLEPSFEAQVQGTESDMIVDKNIVEPIELVDKEEAMDEEEGTIEDVLIDVAGYVYPVDFMILDIKEDECIPLILGTPFFTTVKAIKG